MGPCNIYNIMQMDTTGGSMTIKMFKISKSHIPLYIYLSV